MRVELPYGREKKVALEIPEENLGFVVDRSEAPALKDPREELRRNLRSPIGTPPFLDMVHPRDNVVVVVDDVTRPTPQRVLLPVLLDELNTLGVPDKNIELIIALGTHRKMNQREIIERYGGEVVDRVSVTNHDYRDPKGLVDLGKTISGTKITINKAVYEADFVIGVGNIIPHCYTGWGGGGKIILPGVCGEEITAMTHVTAGKVRPASKLAGRLNHEVRMKIDSVALKAGLNLIVNTVLNQEDKVSRIMVGHPIEAFREGVKTAEKIYCRKVVGYADIVVVSSYPADIDYWQAIKPLVYAHMAVKQGGTLILITPCPERISPMHEIFKEKAALGYHENLGAIEKGEIDDIIAGGGLLLHAQILERAEVICYSDGLTEGDKEALGFKHADTPQEAVEMALKSQGKNAKVGILKCGEILPLTN